MKYLAIDCARRKTGFCVLGETVETGIYETNKNATPGLQLLHATSWLVQLLKRTIPDVVLIEDYAYHAKGRLTTQAELVGCFIMIAAKYGYQVLPVSIPFWKCSSLINRYEVKKGNAQQNAGYLQAVEEVTRMRFKTTDEADAYMIAAVAKKAFNGEGQKPTEKQLRDAISWVLRTQEITIEPLNKI